MKKAILILTAVAVAAVPAFAQNAQKKSIKCAVMPSHSVNIDKATKDKMFADHKGRRYFFCCAGCVPTFKANPDKYAKSESIPTPAPKKP